MATAGVAVVVLVVSVTAGVAAAVAVTAVSKRTPFPVHFNPLYTGPDSEVLKAFSFIQFTLSHFFVSSNS